MAIKLLLKRTTWWFVKDVLYSGTGALVLLFQTFMK
jgi:hypothetical protein